MNRLHVQTCRQAFPSWMGWCQTFPAWNRCTYVPCCWHYWLVAVFDTGGLLCPAVCALHLARPTDSGVPCICGTWHASVVCVIRVRGTSNFSPALYLRSPPRLNSDAAPAQPLALLRQQASTGHLYWFFPHLLLASGHRCHFTCFVEPALAWVVPDVAALYASEWSLTSD